MFDAVREHGLLNVWVNFGSMALSAYGALESSDESAMNAANDADAMMIEFLGRFYQGWDRDPYEPK
jgi:hypothetical protein